MLGTLKCVQLHATLPSLSLIPLPRWQANLKDQIGTSHLNWKLNWFLSVSDNFKIVSCNVGQWTMLIRGYDFNLYHQVMWLEYPQIHMKSGTLQLFAHWQTDTVLTNGEIRLEQNNASIYIFHLKKFWIIPCLKTARKRNDKAITNGGEGRGCTWWLVKLMLVLFKIPSLRWILTILN